jgi:nicotinate-nucleotide adenylyltransferase
MNATIILGGSFNPITPGHVEVAEFLLNYSKIFDSVWIMPCYKHIYNKKMESPEHRMAMCRLATQHDQRITVSDYEIKNQLGGETYYLVKKLLNEDFAKEQDFSLAIGMDNANTFSNWVNHENLERMIRFIIIPRTGVEISQKNAWYLKPPHILLIPEKPLLEISSTKVREFLNDYWNGVRSHEIIQNQKALEIIHPEVLNYIKKNGLYK